jgi:TRAP-type C4-dicarboxylate transport system substrate-binding protein
MKRKILLSALLVTLVVVAFLCLRVPAGAAEKPITLSVAHFWPPTHYFHTEQLTGWMADIEKAANGKVKFQTYPGQTLLKMADIYEGVVKGVADIGISAYTMIYGRHPLMEVSELAGLQYNNATHANMVTWESYKEIDALKPTDAKILYLFDTGPGSIMSSIPIRSLEDLEGQEIHATGTMAEVMKRLGGIPISIGRPEVYLAVKRGVIKGSTGPVEILKGFKEAEVEKFVTPVYGMYNKVFFVIMNLKKWNSLPKDIQRAFDEVNDTWPEKAGRIWDSHQQEAVDWGRKNHGLTLIDLSPEEHARWMKRLDPIQENWVANMEGKGLPAKETLETVKALIEKYASKYPERIY